MQYDITFHPSWWHKNVGICFSQEFFDDPGYRMECDIKMRKALYERFGAYGIGEKDPKKTPAAWNKSSGSRIFVFRVDGV